MRPVHVYILLLRNQQPLYEAQAQAQAQAAPPPGLLARLRAIFSQWKLFNREGNYDTERQTTVD